MDLTNTYNKVQTETLIKTLREKDISLDIIRWIASFLNNRTVEITSENKTIKKLVSDGLPQGDVLSPTLFNIYTEQIHQKTNTGVSRGTTVFGTVRRKLK